VASHHKTSAWSTLINVNQWIKVQSISRR
jgi:hypothetical protein